MPCLLLDTDALVVLVELQSLEDFCGALGCETSECRRLSTAPYVLRGRRFKRNNPSVNAEAIAKVVDAIEPLALSTPLGSEFVELQDALAALSGVGVDAGEAELVVAAMISRDALIVSNDRRMMAALHGGTATIVKWAHAGVSGRVLSLPSCIELLVQAIGLPALQQRYRESGLGAHKSLRILFGSSGDCTPADFEAALAFEYGKVTAVVGEEYLFNVGSCGG